MTEKTIKITCDGTDYVDYRKLTPLQGDLKTITDENLGKLKKSILKYGFTAPGFVWKSGKTLYIIDSHQRIKALEALFEEGYAIPDIPIVYIKAKSKKEAKEKLLHISSQYGKFEKAGLQDFLAEIGLENFNSLRLVNEEIYLPPVEEFDITPFLSDEEMEIKVPEPKICPHCGKEI